jgi:aspartate-semialdehyde dehydrogenase
MGLKLAIVGATGLVGQQLITIIDAQRPDLESVGLIASESSAGSRLDVLGRQCPVMALGDCDFSAYDASFFCVGDELSARFVPEAVSGGSAVVDKSNAFRLDDQVPLVVAGINSDTITAEHRLVANPNCTTIVLAHALAPLHRRFGLELVFAATYQSVTGAGRPGAEALHGGIQTTSFDPDTWRPLQPQPDSIAYNLHPRIGAIDVQGRAGEEAKLVSESRKILAAPGLPFAAHAVRVPVLVGHAIAVTVRLSTRASADELCQTWREAADVRLLGDTAPTPVSAAGHDQVEVGRLRAEPDMERTWSFFVCGDNLRIGAALNGWRILAVMEALGTVPSFTQRQGATDA